MDLLTDKRVYTVLEVAKQLNIGKNLAYELVHRQDFPKLVIGHRKIIVPIKAFERWLDTNSV